MKSEKEIKERIKEIEDELLDDPMALRESYIHELLMELRCLKWVLEEE